jgi:hypothetical protein
MNTKLITKVNEALVAGKICADGHTIFSPAFYAPFFSEDDLRAAGLIRNFRSDLSNEKATIFGTDGIVREELKQSVYNLDFLHWLHQQLEIDEPVTMFGRGSQARQIVEQIYHKLGLTQ